MTKLKRSKENHNFNKKFKLTGNNYFYGPKINATFPDIYTISLTHLTCRVAIGFVSDDLYNDLVITKKRRIWSKLMIDENLNNYRIFDQ